MMRKITTFLVLTLLVCSKVVSQIELKADKGSFQKIMPWGNGYLGVVKKQVLAVVPKSRQLQYYDRTGKILWDNEITPFNFNNDCVVHPKANHAYFVNQPYEKTAELEKTSKTAVLTVYQLDKTGKVTEKTFGYEGVLEPLAAEKDLEACYIGATQNGFVLVIATGENYDSFHVISIDSNLTVQYRAIDFEWDENLYIKDQLSTPKFALSDAHFSMIQLLSEGDKIKTVIKTVDLNDSLNLTLVTNYLNIKGYTMRYCGYAAPLVSYGSYIVFLTGEREEWRGSNIVSVPTLSGNYDFIYSNNKLYAYCYHGENYNAHERRYENQGFLVYELLNKQNELLNPVYTFTPQDDEGRSEYVTLYSSGFIHVWVTDKLITIETTSGEKKQFSKKNTSIKQAFLNFNNSSFIIDKSSEDINQIFVTENGYVGMYGDKIFDFD